MTIIQRTFEDTGFDFVPCYCLETKEDVNLNLQGLEIEAEWIEKDEHGNNIKFTHEGKEYKACTIDFDFF